MRTRSGLFLITLLSSGCASANQPLSAAHASAIKDSVHSALDDLRRYSAAGNWDSMTALYDSDPEFRWIEEGKVVSHAASEIAAKLKSLPSGMKVETTFKDMDVAPVAPGAASVVSGFETSMIDSSGGKISFGGTLTMVLVHRAAGWRILTGHSSAPRPGGDQAGPQ